MSNNWKFNFASATLMLALPVMIFLKHQAYPLATPEVALIFAGILALGAALGLAMTVGRSLGTVAIGAGLITLVLDVQTDWWTSYPLRAGLLMVVIYGISWFSRRYLTRALAVVSGAMFLSTVVLPAGQPVVREGTPQGHNPDLPFILHIVLDEQIGIEGIPGEFDKDGAIAGKMRDFYLGNSFQLYGRAYSRYYQTKMSVPSLLGPSPAEAGNAWFDRLREQGYKIHVIQSDFLRYGGDTSLTYTAEAIQHISRTAVSSKEKAALVIGEFFKLSGYLEPPLGRRYVHLSHLSSWEMIPELRAQVEEARPGQAVFAHILLPHSPYAFSDDCTMETVAAKWLESLPQSAAPRRNTEASRALRYPLYLKQVLCVQEQLNDIFQALKDRGLWENSIVIIHGDHGPRLNIGSDLNRLNERDHQDAYSTLFAVKRPGIPGGYFRERVSIDRLFQRMFLICLT